MGINDRMIFTTPPRERLVVVKVPLEDASCPVCGGSDVRRYPIGWYKGPRMVVKCQECYHSISVERPSPADAWPPFRTVSYDWTASPAERPSVNPRGPSAPER
jgi:hypothetical protein